MGGFGELGNEGVSLTLKNPKETPYYLKGDYLKELYAMPATFKEHVPTKINAKSATINFNVSDLGTNAIAHVFWGTKEGLSKEDKWQNNKAWLLVLPAFIIVAFSGIIPLMTVVNYSIQDIFGPGEAVYVGTEWFEEMLGDHRLREALWRQFLFSGLVLLIEMPLGIMIALAMPTRGWGVSACLVTLALPLVIPWKIGRASCNRWSRNISLNHSVPT